MANSNKSQNKILVVEDDTFLRELYVHQFEKNGFVTQAAEDGEKALEAIKSDSFDCILLDIMIPKIDGLEVLKKLKKDPAKKDTCVVVLSNLGQDDIIKQALEVGAKAYIVKSLYTPDQVVGEVRSLMGT